MVLKAVFLEFSGIVINDTRLQQDLIEELLISENLRPKPHEFKQICLGERDRVCLQQLFSQRGRVVSEDGLAKLLTRKSQDYCQRLSENLPLPLYLDLKDLLFQLQGAKIPVGIVAGGQRADVEWVLAQANLTDHITCLVTDEASALEAPLTVSYQQAIAAIAAQRPDLAPTASECLAIAASFPAITAAKQAGIPVAGVAHLYPYRMMQRRANWAVDYLTELELDWLRQWYERPSLSTVNPH